MNTSFTPGPWAIDESKAYNNLVVSSTVTGDAICEVLCEPDTDVLGEANAHLIAASPNLLSALQEMYSMFYAHEQYDDDSAAAVNLARAAINLATGQEP